MVYNSNKNETKSYKLGDTLAGGIIVMIDYRQMPLPKKPELFSQSRVIVSIETDYWAIAVSYTHLTLPTNREV